MKLPGLIIYYTNWTDRPFVTRKVAEREQEKIEAPELGEICEMIMISPIILENFIKQRERRAFELSRCFRPSKENWDYESFEDYEKSEEYDTTA